MSYTTTVDDKTAVADAFDDAEFGAGFTDKPAVKEPEKPAATEKPVPEAAAQPAVKAPPPKYIRIKETDWAAAVARAESHDAQFSKAFGTIGKLQQTINAIQAQPKPGGKIEISKAAFAEMEKDFPELAQQVHRAMEGALSGFGGGAPDTATIEQLFNAAAVKREVTALEREHPNWRVEVNAVNENAGEKHDPNHPFRKWLATKSPSYQKRINNAETATLLCDALDLFNTESKAPVKPAVSPQQAARNAVLRAAIQPRGDGGMAGADDGADEAFASGFNS